MEKDLIVIKSTFFTKEFKSLFDTIFNCLNGKLKIMPPVKNSHSQCLVYMQNLEIVKNIIETIFYISFPKYKSQKWYFIVNIPVFNRTLIDICFNTIIMINETNVSDRLRWHEKALYAKSKRELTAKQKLNDDNPEFEYPIDNIKNNVNLRYRQFEIYSNHFPDKWPSIGDFVNKKYSKIFGKKYKEDKAKFDNLISVSETDFKIIKFLYEHCYVFDSSFIHATDLGLAKRSTFVYNLLPASQKQSYKKDYFYNEITSKLLETALHVLIIISELHKEYYMEYNKSMSKIWTKMVQYDKYANHIYNLKYKEYY